jgi:hypothetical protein
MHAGFNCKNVEYNVERQVRMIDLPIALEKKMEICVTKNNEGPDMNKEKPDSPYINAHEDIHNA